MSGAMTLAKLTKGIRIGLGQGRDEHYKPWIRVRRRLHSPVSNLQTAIVPIHKRALHLLSGLEYRTGQVAVWLGAREIREQFPAWPEPHRHPGCGRHPELDRKLGDVPGLLEIARAAGIDHGVYPGTQIPFVATLDFNLTFGPWYREHSVLWSCKPRELLDDVENSRRMRERIEMERLYAAAVGAKHAVIDGTQFSDRLATNLDWLQPVRGERHAVCADRLNEYAQQLMEVAIDRSLEAARKHAGCKCHLEDAAERAYFRTAAWRGLIDIDLTQPVLMGRPLRRDTRGERRRLQALLVDFNHER